MTTSETLTFVGDFAPATHDDWRKLVDAALKGAPFSRLESRTYDGLTIEPLYERAASASTVGGRSPGTVWTTMQRVDHPDPAVANALALEDLENGAPGLVLVFAGSISANGYGLEPTAAALERVLDGIDLELVTIDLNLGPTSRHIVHDLAALVKARGLKPASLDLHFSINPIGGFAASGKSPHAWTEMSSDFATMVGTLVGDGFRGPFAVADGRVIHNAGGNNAQELAFALSSAVAYLRALETSGMTLAAARDTIYFRLSADADQFLTMAKFRAARKLWARVEQACGLEPKPALLTAETAWRMLTKRDAYVNMLRNAVAVTAAGLGGADAITVLPHTAPLGLPDAFARRAARNTQFVLLEESNLARVSDPAAGSGALETITDELCAAAWSTFQEIEKAGGVWTALETGSIQLNVAAVRAERQKAVARGRDVLTGTNAYPNVAEENPTVLDIAAKTTALEDTPATVTATRLPRLRLAEPFEALRDASDALLKKTGARPKIFLANLGTPVEFTPRTSFAKNFFEAGGVDAPSDDGGHSTTNLAEAFKTSGAVLACLCSSDKVYEQEAVAAAEALKAAGASHIYLAGRPGEREAALRTAGAETFIYDGCDMLATLRATYDILGKTG
ncbi:MAG TPA: methylmalonyl-CoA mutase subunit beta [Xanthobacteraceae bacterium]|jgi:methylmalonyl-CoA mutase|nr:methylmalonyl-CoA mutase subunit beta [Xanthobacteraceae bacterium]